MSAALRPEPVLRGVPSHLDPITRQKAQEALLSCLTEGGTLAGFCREHGFSKGIAWQWCQDDATFNARYAQARELQAHAVADATLDLADSATPEDYNVRRLQVDTRKWFASKIAPKLYGDRLETNVTVRVEALHLTALEAPALAPIVQPQLSSGETVDAEVVDTPDDSDD